MNRIDRLSAILIQLQSRRVVRAQDIAERFEISLRTVYRDVKALEEAGIPIIGEAGMGYSLMEGYRLPPVMFTREEATALLTAEKLVTQFTDASNGASHKSAMYKIRAVLRSMEKDFLEHIDEHIEVLKARHMQEDDKDLNLTQTILRAIGEKKVIAIDYFASYTQEQTKRCVEPVGIFYLDHYWHLIGFCRLRNDYRDFRFDRISGLELTQERFKQQHLSLKTYLERLYKHHELHTVVIRIEKQVERYLGQQKYYQGFVSEKDCGEHTEMTFMSPALEGFARWFLMFGDHAVIMQPERLKERVRAIALKMTGNI